MWGPLLEEAGCQIVIAAHQHRFRYDAPGEDCDGRPRSWAQIVGGGPDLPSGDEDADGAALDQGKFPTVIEGQVNRRRLKIVVHNLRTGQVQGSYSFKPRGKS